MRPSHPILHQESGQALGRRRRPCEAAILLGAILSATWACPARAEGPAAGARAEGSAAASPSADELGAQAYSAYASGKFTEAISKYLKIYESTGSPAALLNVATIYDRNLREPEIAAEYYRRYLRTPNADSQRIEKVNERLIAMKREATQAAQTPAPVRQAPEPRANESAPSPTPVRASSSSAEPRRSSGVGRVAGAVTVGVGLASLGASGILSLLARKKNKDADAYCTGNVCSDARGVDLAHQAGDFATGATIAFTSGAVLVGTGITIYFLSPSRSEEPKAATLSISPLVGPVASGINLEGSF
jgi:hypothetical protein